MECLRRQRAVVKYGTVPNFDGRCKKKKKKRASEKTTDNTEKGAPLISPS